MHTSRTGTKYLMSECEAMQVPKTQDFKESGDILPSPQNNKCGGSMAYLKDDTSSKNYRQHKGSTAIWFQLCN